MARGGTYFPKEDTEILLDDSIKKRFFRTRSKSGAPVKIWENECLICSKIRWTASQASTCRSCVAAAKRGSDSINLENQLGRALYLQIRDVWYAMRFRCYSKDNRGYYNYGGRGIRVCKEWLEDKDLFIQWVINNGYKQGLCIDRIDNNGNYSPENCRFVTNEVNCNNTRKNRPISMNGDTKNLSQWERELKTHRRIVLRMEEGQTLEEASKKRIGGHEPIYHATINGETKSLVDWGREYNIKSGLIRDRVKQGWDIEKALITPISKGKNKGKLHESEKN